MRRKPHRKIGEWIASAAAVLGLCVIPFLPRRVVTRLSRCLGDLGYLTLPWLRQVALENLRIAYGGRLSERRRRAVVRSVFRNFALILLDFFWFTVRSRRRLSAYLRFDPSFDICFQTRPLIAVGAHFGNWEVLGQACALRGCPFLSVAQPIRNRVVNRMLRAFRSRGGQQVVPREGALRALLRVLRQGGRVALLIDQNTVPSKGGVYVDFFGVPVPITGAPYILSKLNGAPIVFAYAICDKRGTYHAKASSLVSPPGQRDSESSLVQHIARLTEAAIRRHPGHWLWMYKRWRYIPPGRSRDGYPNYAVPLPPAFSKKNPRPTMLSEPSQRPSERPIERRVQATL